MTSIGCISPVRSGSGSWGNRSVLDGRENNGRVRKRAVGSGDPLKPSLVRPTDGDVGGPGRLWGRGRKKLAGESFVD
jgi:hypothetical protein